MCEIFVAFIWYFLYFEWYRAILHKIPLILNEKWDTRHVFILKVRVTIPHLFIHTKRFKREILISCVMILYTAWHSIVDSCFLCGHCNLICNLAFLLTDIGLLIDQNRCHRNLCIWKLCLSFWKFQIFLITKMENL